MIKIIFPKFPNYLFLVLMYSTLEKIVIIYLSQILPCSTIKLIKA